MSTLTCLCVLACVPGRGAALDLSVEQITHGPDHHFYGYIGHVGNTPWNGNGRYLVLLRTDSQDRMPEPAEPADIVLLDAQQDYAVNKIEETRAWNFQQGAMLYWNPDAPDTQFFFNDRDPDTQKVSCVLYDIEEGRRVREYRFKDRPVANSGAAIVVYKLEFGAHAESPLLDIGEYHSGPLRIDPAPCRRRDNEALAVPALAPDGTRQTFVLHMQDSA